MRLRPERTQQLRSVFTGDPDPCIEALAYEAGALGFIAKPFDPRDVGSFVNRALAHLAPMKSVGRVMSGSVRRRGRISLDPPTDG
jgi:FixJ family two-component response regulator